MVESRVIEFYLEFLMSQIDHETREAAYIFGIFVFFNLARNQNNPRELAKIEAELIADGILDREILVMPCWTGQHWFIVVVVKSEGIIRSFDSFFSEARCARACAVMNSLLKRLGYGGSGRQFGTVLNPVSCF